MGSAQDAAQNAIVKRGQTVSPGNRRGLLRPFRRDGARDFATATGDDLLISRIGQIVGTSGELPWNPALNSQLDLLRNTNNSLMLQEFATAYCRDAIALFEPSVVLLSVTTVRTDRSIDMTLQCQPVDNIGKLPQRTITAQASIATTG